MSTAVREQFKPGTRVRYTGTSMQLRPLNGMPMSQILTGPVVRPGDVGVIDGNPDAGVRVRFENGFGQCPLRDLEVISHAV